MKAAFGTMLFPKPENCNELTLPQQRKLSIPDLPGAAPAFLANHLATSKSPNCIIVVYPNPIIAQQFPTDFSAFSQYSATYFPMQNAVEENGEENSTRLLIARELASLNSEIASGLSKEETLAKHNGPIIISSSAHALIQPIPDVEKTELNSLVIKPDEDCNQEEFIRWIMEHGYKRAPEVFDKCVVAIKGGIIDIWPPTEKQPLRIEFFDDIVESIRTFDAETQRSVKKIFSATIVPASIPRQKKKLLTDLLPPDTIILWEDSNGIDENSSSFPIPADAIAAGHSFAGLRERLDRREDICELFSGDPPPPGIPTASLPISASGLQAIEIGHGSHSIDPELISTQRQIIIDSLTKQCADKNTSVHICLDTEGTLEHLATELGETPLKLQLAPISGGFTYKAGKHRFVYLSQADLYGRSKRPVSEINAYGESVQLSTPKHGSATEASLGLFSLEHIEYGDLIVHAEHGIGKYIGISEMLFGGKHSEVICIEYANNERLYVPVTKAHLVSRYSGTNEGHIRPHSLKHKGKWDRAKDNARRAVQELAISMLTTQAKRSGLKGHAFNEYTPWLHEFEATFPYTETQGQLECIAAVKQDMYSSRPMDRLICGDAGFGKTEIAIRAAFISAMQGKQVAVLVPTTVLAQQHYDSFVERMQAYPLNIALHSRFCSQRERQKTIEGLESGAVDIVIGTHGIIQPSVKFKDLGLVIIDEEQRFGVRHKEFLKSIKTLVDVITLSATPIPRTLYLGLSGARDMSLLQSPPKERQATETKVVRQTDEVITSAIRNELSRGGQVFYLHNRVMSIDIIRKRLQQLVPEARVCVAHGQMNANEIEARIRAFSEGQYDVLLSTTIIENGIDIPRANTIIIDRADRFGIADLYQLRGRVGRGTVKGYAYLLIPEQGQIDSDARKRLKALRQHSELGSGLNLAMRDLSIRGAGNLLGAEQSGHISAMGFTLYCQLLRQAIADLNGEKLPTIPNVAINLPFINTSPTNHTDSDGATLPYDYISDDYQRINFYRRIAECYSDEQLEQIKQDTIDRFGKLPKPVSRLFAITALKLLAGKYGIDSISYINGELHIYCKGIVYRTANYKLPRPSGKNPDALLTSIKNLVKCAGQAIGKP